MTRLLPILLLACTASEPQSLPAAADQGIWAEHMAQPSIAAHRDGVVVVANHWNETSWRWEATVFEGNQDGIESEWPLPGPAPTVGIGREPLVATDGERRAVIWSSGDPRGSTIQLSLGAVGSEPPMPMELAFGGPDHEAELVDQPTVAFAPDGELWVSWKFQVNHDLVLVVAARESEAFAPRTIEAIPGRACECCPHTLSFVDDTLTLALRNNIANVREIVLLQSTGEAFGEPAWASDTGWFVEGCPFEGPSVASHRGSLWVAWADPTDGEMAVHAAMGSAQGFLPSQRALPDEDHPHQSPKLLSTGTSLWLASEAVWQGTYLAVLDGDEWVPNREGLGIFDPELALMGTTPVLAGRTADGELLVRWLNE